MRTSSVFYVHGGNISKRAKKFPQIILIDLQNEKFAFPPHAWETLLPYTSHHHHLHRGSSHRQTPSWAGPFFPLPAVLLAVVGAWFSARLTRRPTEKGDWEQRRKWWPLRGPPCPEMTLHPWLKSRHPYWATTARPDCSRPPCRPCYPKPGTGPGTGRRDRPPRRGSWPVRCGSAPWTGHRRDPPVSWKPGVFYPPWYHVDAERWSNGHETSGPSNSLDFSVIILLAKRESKKFGVIFCTDFLMLHVGWLGFMQSLFIQCPHRGTLNIVELLWEHCTGDSWLLRASFITEIALRHCRVLRVIRLLEQTTGRLHSYFSDVSHDLTLIL